MAPAALRADRRSRESGGSGESSLPDRGCVPCGILPFPATTTTPRSRHGIAQPNPTHRAAVASLRLSAGTGATAKAKLGSKPTAGATAGAIPEVAMLQAVENYFQHRL